MPYEIETNDGIVIAGIPDHIKADDPSVKQKVFAARANAAQAKMAKEGATGGQLMQAGLDPTEGNSFLKNLAIGGGKAIVDAGRGLSQVGAGVADFVSPRRPDATGEQPSSRVDDIRQQVARSRAQDEPLMNTGGGVTGDVLGSIAMALAPGGAVKGAGLLAKAGGATDAGATLNAVGGSLLAPRSIAGAAGTGAVMGALQPSTSTDETITNTALGGAASALIPAGMTGAHRRPGAETIRW